MIDWLLRLPVIRTWWHRKCRRDVAAAFRAAVSEKNFSSDVEPIWPEDAWRAWNAERSTRP